MNIISTLQVSTTAIIVNKVRSFLTMLGIIIGVAAIILLVSIGAGIQSFVNKQFETLGSTSLFVLPGTGEVSAGPPIANISKFDQEIISRLKREEGRTFSQVVASQDTFSVAKYQDKSKNMTLTAMTTNGFEVSKLNIVAGRKYTDSEDKASKKVTVLGPTLKESLFPSTDPLGERITIGSTRYTIIGITEKLGSVAGVDADNVAYIPLGTYLTQTGNRTVNSILVSAPSQDKVETTKTKVEEILLTKLTKDDFNIKTQEQLLDTILSIVSFITYALGGIAGISLLVGGIGISNIMLVSVTERTREIGLRKALGATPGDILAQFLLEATILSLIGGGVGVLLGVLGAQAISQFFTTTVTPWSIMVAFGFSAAIGIIFGSIPAYRAAKLNPIEALRYE